MTIQTLQEPSEAQKQLDLYNRASTTLIQRSTYSPSAGTAWAIVGCKLAAAVTQEDVPTLVTNIEALSEVSNVANPQFWAHTPSSLLINDPTETHELRLLVDTILTASIGYGADVRGLSQKQHEVLKPPLDSKILVLNVVVPSELDQSGISSLETAIEGVTGIQTCEHLVDGVIPSNASGVQLQVVTRMRIDEIGV